MKEAAAGGERKSSSSNILAKTLQKCRSLGGGGHHRRHHPSSSSGTGSSAPPSPSPHHRPIACSVPAGCFAVLVGPEKERFAVRARCANHPLFRALLDEAETEYGFAGCDGPLELPCAVDDFMEVMWEMEQQGAHGGSASPSCARFAGARHHHHQQHHQQQGYHMMSPGSSFLVAGRS